MKISPRWPSLCWNGSATATGSVLWRSAPALLPGSCNMHGRGMCVNSPRCLRPHCWKQPTASSAPEDLALPTGAETSVNVQAPVPSGNLSLDATIRQHVQYVLDLNRGNKLRAARQLCISRSTLYRILATRRFWAH